jgi:hypothetical protein
MPKEVTERENATAATTQHHLRRQMTAASYSDHSPSSIIIITINTITQQLSFVLLAYCSILLATSLFITVVLLYYRKT